MFRAVEKGGQGTTTISWSKIFFHVQSENMKYEYMWITCETLFIEQEISDKKQIIFSEIVVLAVSWATTGTNKEL